MRRRLAPLLDNSRAEIELINALLAVAAGSPYLYYGDEIGMGENIWLPDRDSVRTPMQWNPDRNAGFSTADPGKLYSPVIQSLIYKLPVGSTSRPSWRRRPRCCTGPGRCSPCASGTRCSDSAGFVPVEADNPHVLAFLRCWTTARSPTRPARPCCA
jgi:maltose alpha-D-glucosyltransferase/alpha-amylase